MARAKWGAIGGYRPKHVLRYPVGGFTYPVSRRLRCDGEVDVEGYRTGQRCKELAVKMNEWRMRACADCLKHAEQNGGGVVIV